MSVPFIYLTVALCVLFICSVIIGIVEAFQLKDKLSYWCPDVFNTWVDECGASLCIAILWPIFVIIGTFFGFVLLTKFLTLKIINYFIISYTKKR